LTLGPEDGFDGLTTSRAVADACGSEVPTGIAPYLAPHADHRWGLRVGLLFVALFLATVVARWGSSYLDGERDRSRSAPTRRRETAA